MSGVLGLWVTHKDQTTTFKFHLRKREKQDYKAHKPSMTDLEISMVNASTVTVVNCLDQLLEVLS